MSNKYKILVVEDEPKIRSFMGTILETNGYKVVTADTCHQGILMFFSHCPDLIVLDLGLPDMDGLEFIKTARESSAVPIIVLSARTAEEDKVSALDLGQMIISQNRSAQQNYWQGYVPLCEIIVTVPDKECFREECSPPVI